MGEENFLITKSVSTPYVEATEEALEYYFCSFKIVHATIMKAAINEVIKSHGPKVEVMITRVMRSGRYCLNQT